jgi:hypothetical protein
MYNQLGTLLNKQKALLNIGTNRVEMNSSKFPTGTYFIKAVTNNQLIQTIQTIKQ